MEHYRVHMEHFDKESRANLLPSNIHKALVDYIHYNYPSIKEFHKRMVIAGRLTISLPTLYGVIKTKTCCPAVQQELRQLEGAVIKQAFKDSDKVTGIDIKLTLENLLPHIERHILRFDLTTFNILKREYEGALPCINRFLKTPVSVG